MIVHTAHIVCGHDHIDAFRSRLLRHAATTMEMEPGCICFDVHQSVERPELFYLHECYQDQQALDAHRASGHFARFRKDTANWVCERTWWFWSKCALED